MERDRVAWEPATLPAATVYEFNCLPARYLHPSWLAREPHRALVLRAARCRRSEQRVSEWLLERFGLSGPPCLRFAEPAPRCALLPPPHLEAVLFYAGLTLSHAHIRRLVLSADVQRLRERLGEAGYRFAIDTAPLLAGDEPQLRVPAWPARGDPRTHSLVAGLSCLGSALRGQPHALRGRLALKLPRRWSAALARPPLPLPADRCQRLLRRLLGALGMAAALGYREPDA